jgi:hypothetical protein
VNHPAIPASAADKNCSGVDPYRPGTTVHSNTPCAGGHIGIHQHPGIVLRVRQFRCHNRTLAVVGNVKRTTPNMVILLLESLLTAVNSVPNRPLWPAHGVPCSLYWCSDRHGRMSRHGGIARSCEGLARIGLSGNPSRQRRSDSSSEERRGMARGRMLRSRSSVRRRMSTVGGLLFSFCKRNGSISGAS